MCSFCCVDVGFLIERDILEHVETSRGSHRGWSPLGARLPRTEGKNANSVAHPVAQSEECFLGQGHPPSGIPRLARDTCGPGNFLLKKAYLFGGLLSFARPSPLTGGTGFGCNRLLRVCEQTAQTCDNA